jgi:TolB protein
MNADGTNQTRLTTDPANDNLPSWSPDGRNIAFQSDRDGNGEVYVMNVDGSGQMNLSNDSAHDGEPDWHQGHIPLH